MSDAATTQAPAPPARLSGRVFLALADIKLAHSVFALPFAVLGAFLVAPRHPGQHPDQHGVLWARFVGMLALVVLCMVFARTWAMLVNRVADRGIDAANPRTARRAFARGALTPRDGGLMLAACAIGFVASASLFGLLFGNWWPAILAVPVLLWIAIYSYTKRFTWLCHVFLGGALAASPLAAAIAVGGPESLAIDASGPVLLLLAAMVLSWVAGFDVIYALQDLDYDREVGLNSVPARFGWRRAVWISRLLHALAIIALAFAWRVEPRLGGLFLAAVGLVSALLVWEHLVLAKRGRAGIPMAFFTLNGIVSVVLGTLGSIDAG